MTQNVVINNFQIIFPGQTTAIPRIGHLYCPDNTLSQVAAAGALQASNSSLGLLSTDILFVAASNGNAVCQPSIAPGTGIITLVALTAI
jgi:hypothetical protein